MSAPFGFYPLFYSVGPQEIRIATSVSALLESGVDAELDAGALATFVRIGCFLGDDTPFVHIRAMPAGGSLCWERGQLSLAKRPPSPAAWTGDRKATVEAYAELFAEAVAARPPRGRSVVPLSGGEDSRHIFLGLLDKGVRVDLAVTLEHFPTRPQEDVRVAALLAEAHGVPHQVLRQSRRLLYHERAKNHRTHFCAAEHGWGMPMAELLGEAPTTLYDGIGGDILSAGLQQDPERLALCRAGQTRAFAELLIADDPVGRQLLNAEGRRLLPRDLAVERIEAEVAQHLDEVNPVASFFFWNRTRRMISLMPLGVYGSGAAVAFPYLEPELFTFLRSLPPEATLDKRLHRETILRAYPRATNIPFEDKQAPARPDGGFARRAATDTLLRLLTQRSGLLRRHFIAPRLLKAAVSGSYGDMAWMRPLTLNYLADLRGQTRALEGRQPRSAGAAWPVPQVPPRQPAAAVGRSLD